MPLKTCGSVSVRLSVWFSRVSVWGMGARLKEADDPAVQEEMGCNEWAEASDIVGDVGQVGRALSATARPGAGGRHAQRPRRGERALVRPPHRLRCAGAPRRG